jgi:hypothetical protein
MSGSVDIVLPGLFELPVDELKAEFLKDELPYLNRFLSQARTKPTKFHSIDAIILDILRCEQLVGLPLAQAFVEPWPPESGCYLLFQAVHLQADMHNAIILPIGMSQENVNEIDLIINDLKELFNVDFDIKVIADGLYLMKLNGFSAPEHYPHILSVLGKTANPYVEQTRENLPWYRLTNEIQMFMHQHAVNQQRLLQGQTPINSLWFWGAGQLPKAVHSNPDWYCDDLVLTRFAESLGLTTRSISQIVDCDPELDSVVIDLRLIEALKTGKDSSLTQLLRDIDRELFEFLPSTGCSVRLRAGFEYDFEWTKYSRLNFWRKRKNLAHWLMQSPVL